MTRTKSEQARFDNMKDLGCIACILDGQIEAFSINPRLQPDIHHMLSGGHRISHEATVPLCYWHHKGEVEPYSGLTLKVMLPYYGPSWHKHRRAFRERYGSDAELIEIVNKYLGEKC